MTTATTAKQRILEATTRGAVAVWITDDNRRMDVGMARDGYRIEFSTNYVTTAYHKGLTIQEAARIAARWIQDHE